MLTLVLEMKPVSTWTFYLSEVHLGTSNSPLRGRPSGHSSSGKSFGQGNSWLSEHFDNYNFKMIVFLSFFFLKIAGGKNTVVFKW